MYAQDLDYDYETKMTEDIEQQVEEHLEYIDLEDLDDGIETLDFEYWYDLFYDNDNITGNASGSYTFSTYQAQEYVFNNIGYAEDAIKEFGVEWERAYDWEYIDVLIRCWMLSDVLGSFLKSETYDGQLAQFVRRCEEKKEITRNILEQRVDEVLVLGSSHDELLTELKAKTKPRYYNAGTYGWNYDVYVVYLNGKSYAIVEGYRPLVKWDRVSEDLMRTLLDEGEWM